MWVVKSTDYLAHSKGAWKNHKYIRKEGEGSNARYFYEAAQRADQKYLEEKEKSHNALEYFNENIWPQVPQDRKLIEQLNAYSFQVRSAEDAEAAGDVKNMEYYRNFASDTRDRILKDGRIENDFLDEYARSMNEHLRARDAADAAKSMYTELASTANRLYEEEKEKEGSPIKKAIKFVAARLARKAVEVLSEKLKK